MRLQTKIILITLPLLLGSLILVSLWSYSASRNMLLNQTQQYVYGTLSMYLNQTVVPSYELLRQNSLDGIPSFVKTYQQDAVRHLETVRIPWNAISLIALSDGTSIFEQIPEQPGLEKEIIDSHLSRSHSDAQHLVKTTGGTYLVQGIYFEPWDWHILIAIKESEIASQLRELAWRGIIILATLTLLLSSITILVARRVIISPVEKLSELANQIGSTRKAVATGITTKDELGTLAHNLEIMSQTIEDNDRKLTERNIQLEEDVLLTMKNLQMSEAKYRSLFQNMQVGCAYHRIELENGKPVDFTYLEVNEAFEQHTGLKRHNIIGRRVTEFLPQIKNDVFDWIGTYGKIALYGGSIAFTQFSNISNRFYSVSAYQIMPLYFAVTIMDVTEERKRETALERSLKEKQVMLKEIHHRVKNNLQVISSLLTLQAMSVDDTALSQKLMEGTGRIQSMALVHEELYKSTTLSSIKLSEYVQRLFQNLSRIADDLSIRFTVDGEMEVTVTQAVPIGLMLNEMLTNTQKYAFSDEQQDRSIVIRFRNENNLNIIEYADSGKGFDHTLLDNTPTLGLVLIRELTVQLGGEITLLPAPGTHYRLTYNPSAEVADYADSSDS